MPTPASDATTRLPTVSRGPRRRAGALLTAGDVLVSTQTRIRYRVERLLGEGGFGQVYLGRRLDRSTVVPATVGIKVSTHIDGWVREAYFGQLLNNHPRAIRVFDQFPSMGLNGQVLYCLALEYARHGDLSAYLARSRRGWSEATVRREIAGILGVLDTLHRGQMLHRDLTPVNVFVCDSGRLKLGDFGIVQQQSDRRGITARTLNVLTAPSDILAGIAPKWQARDDVYQVGQLVGMLLKGTADTRIRKTEIRNLPCGDHLKEVVYRCIGERRKRYESADELIKALRHRPAALKAGTIRTLAGVHLAFTGILSRPRAEAIRLATHAGAIVHGMPSASTTVVVRGRPNPLQAAGKDAGLKLMEIRRLRARGHRITLLNDRQFWRLVDTR